MQRMLLEPSGSLLYCRNFEFALGATSDPNLHSSSERLQATSQALSLNWRSGRVDLSFDGLSACGYLVRVHTSSSIDKRASHSWPHAYL